MRAEIKGGDEKQLIDLEWPYTDGSSDCSRIYCLL